MLQIKYDHQIQFDRGDHHSFLTERQLRANVAGNNDCYTMSIGTIIQNHTLSGTIILNSNYKFF